jgi:anti-sigma factor RsiW
MTTHLTTEVLEEYLLGRVVEPELTRVEEHLLKCQKCIDRAESLERFIARLGDAAASRRNDVPKKAQHR